MPPNLVSPAPMQVDDAVKRAETEGNLPLVGYKDVSVGRMVGATDTAVGGRCPQQSRHTMWQSTSLPLDVP